MTKRLLFAVLLLSMARLSAQTCGNPQSQIDLHGNNIQARILNAGDLFWDLSQGKFIPNPAPDGSGPTTVYSAGLWLGGIDGDGNLELAAAKYRNTGQTDFYTGPINAESGTADPESCSNWDRHFKVSRERIFAFRNALSVLVNNPELAKTQFPEIMGWPGQGNPFFTDVSGFNLPATSQGLAPFWDADEDGIYNPLTGDFPALSLQGCATAIPTEMVWCVFNDEGAGAVHGTGGRSLRVEVQLTAWAYSDSISAVLNNTVFTSHKIISRSNEPIDSFYAGIWTDFDIGCFADDYVGTVPALHSMYVYNQDTIDGINTGGCANSPTFSGIPPVQSVTFLNVSLDKSIVVPANNIGSGQPDEYYNYLTGRWGDGTPLTYGGTGYQSGGPETNHAFPDDPANAAGWSMCTANVATTDRRMIGSHKFGTLEPGQTREFNLAWTVHPNPNLPCGLGSTFEDIAFIREIYENLFDCVTSTNMPLLDAQVTLSPNPATNAITIQYDDLSVLEMRCFDAAGRLVRTVRNLPNHQYSLDVASWNNGTYTVQLLTSGGSVSRRLVVLH